VQVGYAKTDQEAGQKVEIEASQKVGREAGQKVGRVAGQKVGREAMQIQKLPNWLCKNRASRLCNAFGREVGQLEGRI